MFRYADLYDKAGVWNFDEPFAPMTDSIGRGTAYDWECYTHGQLIRKNTDFSRVVDKMLLLNPEKQHECVASMKLLPVGDRRSEPKSAGGDNFRALFDGMLDENTPWDTTYTISQRNAFKRKREDVMQSPSDELDRFERYSSSKASRYDDEPMTIEQQYANGYDVEMDDAGRPREYVSVDGHPDIIGLLPAQRAVYKKLKAPARMRSFDDHARGQAAIESTAARVLALVAELQVNETAIERIAKEAKAGPGFTTTGYLCHVVHTIINVVSATDAQKLLLLNELLRISANQLCTLVKLPIGSSSEAVRIAVIARVNAPVDGVRFAGLLASCFAPFAAQHDLKLSLQQIAADLTQLERQMQKPGSDYTDVTGCPPGTWNPDFKAVVGKNDTNIVEDGRVFLGVSNDPHSCRIPLLHDAYAATLAESHSVFFDVPYSEDLNKFVFGVQAGLKQSRCDALYSSLAISVIMSGAITLTPSVPDLKIVIDPSALARLRRSAPIVRAPLLSQIHLTMAIEAARVILLAIVGGKPYYKSADPTVSRQELSPPVLLEADRIVFESVLKGGFRVIPPVESAIPEDVRASFNERFGIFDRVPVGAEEMEATNYSERTTDYAILMLEEVFTHKPDQLAAEFEAYTKRLLENQALVHAYYEGMNQATASPEEKKSYKDWLPVYGTMNALKTKYEIAHIYHFFLEFYKLNPVVKPVSVRGGLGTESATGAWNKVTIRGLLDRASLVSGEFFRFCVENDIPVALSINTWRPSKTYNMGSMIRMQTGTNGAAKTYYKNPDFMMAGKTLAGSVC
jgi:hypothetical protein